MAQWGSKNNKTSAPVYTVDASTGKSGKDEFNKTVFRQTPSNKENGLSSPGWVRVVPGKGKIKSLIINDGGTGYDVSTDTITIDEVNCSFTVDDNGQITTIEYNINDTLVDKIPSIVINSIAGTGAIITLETEGRIGRSQQETLIAIRTKL